MKIIIQNKKGIEKVLKDETIHTIWISNGENVYRVKAINETLQMKKLSAGSLTIEIINDFIAIK